MVRDFPRPLPVKVFRGSTQIWSTQRGSNRSQAYQNGSERDPRRRSPVEKQVQAEATLGSSTKTYIYFGHILSPVSESVRRYRRVPNQRVASSSNHQHQHRTSHPAPIWMVSPERNQPPRPATSEAAFYGNQKLCRHETSKMTERH